MGHRKDLGRQWKLSKHLILENFRKNEPEQHMLHPPEYPLQGFEGKRIKPVGKVSLPVSSEILTTPEQKLSLLM
jgi:hypothetical protein